jgi:hypothetical protein
MSIISHEVEEMSEILDGLTITPDVLREAKATLSLLIEYGWGIPGFSPTADGGMEASFDRDSVLVTLCFESDGSFTTMANASASDN